MHNTHAEVARASTATAVVVLVMAVRGAAGAAMILNKAERHCYCRCCCEMVAKWSTTNGYSKNVVILQRSTIEKPKDVL